MSNNTNFKVGDLVSTKIPYPANYSGYTPLYPVQFFTPIMQGSIKHLDPAPVRSNTKYHIVEFEGVVHGTVKHPQNTWLVWVPVKDLVKV